MFQKHKPQYLSSANWISRSKNFQLKPISFSSTNLIKLHHLQPNCTLPLVISPTESNFSLAGWMSNNLEYVETNLLKYGGVLFRGFSIKNQTDFVKILQSSSVKLMDYLEGATPRTEVEDKIYTSTEYPAHRSIALHNELSIAVTFPIKIWFLCLKSAEQGGETPICDMRKVFQRLSPKLKERFLLKNWMLVRNYGNGFGLPWQTSFHTTDKRVVEAYCRKNAIDFEWKDGDCLRTCQVRPAVIKHPKTGEMVWFNHIAFWHISTLESELRETLLVDFQEKDLPYSTYYGDGSPIEVSVIEEICQAYQQETVFFPWQEGDLLMLDNVLVAHGRNPFVGTRKVLAAMGEAYTRTDV
jgi:alpha-ketoglutarate-dependent taurine dioxygenase